MRTDLPTLLWLAYAVSAYVLWTLVFRVRYGVSPVLNRFPPRSAYEFTDTLLGLLLVGYSVWIAFGPRPAQPISLRGGMAVWAVGCLLRAWAVGTLGPHWRIGQADTPASPGAPAHVLSGPYRYMRHPINAALVIVAIGQGLMTGPDVGAMVLVAGAMLYMLVQGKREDAHWRK